MSDERLVGYSYNKIAAKLPGLLRMYAASARPGRIVVCCCDADSGKANAYLTLLKQFGMAPLEVYCAKGNIEPRIVEELSGFDGFTLIVHTIPMSGELTMNATASAAHKVVSLRSVVPYGLAEFADTQVTRISALVERDRAKRKNGYLYLCGFSVAGGDEGSLALGGGEFLPWYLEVNRDGHGKHVLRQSRLAELLAQLDETETQIQNLDEFLDDMAYAEADPEQ